MLKCFLRLPLGFIHFYVTLEHVKWYGKKITLSEQTKQAHLKVSLAVVLELSIMSHDLYQHIKLSFANMNEKSLPNFPNK